MPGVLFFLTRSVLTAAAAAVVPYVAAAVVLSE